MILTNTTDLNPQDILWNKWTYIFLFKKIKKYIVFEMDACCKGDKCNGKHEILSQKQVGSSSESLNNQLAIHLTLSIPSFVYLLR